MRGHAFCWFSLLTVLLLAGEPPARGYGNQTRHGSLRSLSRLLDCSPRLGRPAQGSQLLIGYRGQSHRSRPAGGGKAASGTTARQHRGSGRQRASRAGHRSQPGSRPDAQGQSPCPGRRFILLSKSPSRSASTPWLVWMCWARAPSKSTTRRVRFTFGPLPLGELSSLATEGRTTDCRCGAQSPFAPSAGGHRGLPLILFEPSHAAGPMRASEVQPRRHHRRVGAQTSLAAQPEARRSTVWQGTSLSGPKPHGWEPGLRRIDESGGAGHHQTAIDLGRGLLTFSR